MPTGGFVFDEGALNTSALTVPGAYVELEPPGGLSVPGPSNAMLHVGTGSWGPTNQALGPFGDTASAAAAVGQFSASLFATDPFDVMRGVMQSLGEAETTVSINDWIIRVSDGTDAAADVVLEDTTPTTPLTGVTLPAKYTGIVGNTLKVTIAAGQAAHSFNVTIVGNIGGTQVGETYLNIAGSASGPSPFWANLVAALANGTANRGPSQLIGTPTLGSVSAINPALGTFSLAGGTDGRSGVTAATIIGTDSSGSRTGMYAGRGLPIVPAYIWLGGVTDTTKASAIQAFCLTEVVRHIFPLPSGTSTASAVTTRGTTGISDKRFMYGKDWVYWTDPISGLTLFTEPTAIMAGRATSLSPEISPLNKPVTTVIATEHPAQYPGDEIGLLNINGIWVITNPCLGSSYMGIASASTTSLNPIEQPVEYERLKDYIGINFAATLGQFVGQKQGISDPDKTRSNCKATIDSEMQDYFENNMIVDWETQCDSKLNTPNSIQAGYLRAKLKYIPYSTVKFVVLDIATTTQLSAGQAFAQSQLVNQGG